MWLGYHENGISVVWCSRLGHLSDQTRGQNIKICFFYNISRVVNLK